MHPLSVEVLTTAPPAFTASEAERIADEHFGVTATARSMPSERDQNFHLSRQEGTGFVLKLSNRAEAPIVTDFQTQALLHIAEQAPELAVPRVCRTLSGATELTLDVEAGHHTVRLLTYLDGVPCADPEHNTCPAPETG